MSTENQETEDRITDTGSNHTYNTTYLPEQSIDNGKKALEIVKVLIDKKYVTIDNGENFTGLMDALIEIL